LILIYTLVARTVIILVLTILNNYVTNVVLLSFTDFADLVAYITLFSVLHFAVEDLRTALVIGYFYVFSLAVETLSSALLVYAMGNCRDTYVCILCKVLPVEAFQTGPAAVLVVAVGDG